MRMATAGRGTGIGRAHGRGSSFTRGSFLLQQVELEREVGVVRCMELRWAAATRDPVLVEDDEVVHDTPGSSDVPTVEADLAAGALVVIEDGRVRELPFGD